MASARDTVLGELAVERGYLTHEQVDEARELQRKMHDEMGLDQPLVQVLVSKKWLTLDQAQEVRNAAAVKTGEASIVAGYEVVSKIGAGGMGAVYKARKIESGRYVALKILPPSLATEGLIARFRREAEITAKLHHENIVGCVEFGQDPRRKCWFCALELIEGENLLKRTERLGKLPEAEAVSITRQMAEALQHAFNNGLVHRDVKPENIMVTPDGTAKLLDLGLARPANMEATRLTLSGMFVGSPYYASPEQAKGEKEIDTRSDIYSLGATLYHMVTGRPPFVGGAVPLILQKHVVEQIQWPAEITPGLSNGVCEVIGKMMAKDPADRYQTPNDLRRDLDLLTGGDEPDVDEKALKSSSVKMPALPRAVRVRRDARARAAGRRDRPPRRPRDSTRERRREAPHERRKLPPPGKGASQGTKAVIVVVVMTVVVAIGLAMFLAPGMRDRPPEKPEPATVKKRPETGPEHTAAGGRAPEGKILREWWLPAVGKDRDVLAMNDPPAPTGRELIESFDGPKDWKDNYNTRIRGYVHPPVDGDYIFRLCSDDNSQLWLSTDEAPANVTKIAEIDSHKGYTDWAKASRPITLRAGRCYYVEVIHREGHGGDHIRVGWDRPDGVSERPIPGKHLSAWRDPSTRFADSGSRPEALEGRDVPRPPRITVGGELHLKINCGANVRDVAGWERDDPYVKGGEDFTFQPNPDTTGVPNAAPADVYKTCRHFDHSYSFPSLPDGTYTVRLHFYDVMAKDERTMKYTMEGSVVLRDYDPPQKRPTVRDFEVTVSDGNGLQILCDKDVSTDVFECGIEIMTHAPATRGPATPDDVATKAPGALRPDLARGLVAHWTFDEAEGTVARDSSGKGNHGTVRGGARWAKGKLGGALDFDGYDGSDDYVTAPDSASLRDVQEGDYTLTAWVCPDTDPPGTGKANNSQYAIITKMGHHPGPTYANGQRFWVSHWLTGNVHVGAMSGSTFAPGGFHHVAGVVSRTNGTVDLYVDGQPEGSNTFTAGTAAREYGTEPWRIGCANPGAGTYRFAMDGKIDDVRVYDRALSADEVKALSLLGLAPKPPTITSAAPADAVKDVAYSHTFTATGNPATFTWSMRAADETKLNNIGLSWNAGTAKISGTPSATGTAADVTVTCSNGEAPAVTQTFAIVVAEGSAYQVAVLVDAPVVYYRFEETVGSTVAANSGSAGAAYDATLQGAVTWQATSGSSALGAAVDLGGSGVTGGGHFISATYLSNYLNTGPCSLEFWVKTTQTTGGTAGWNNPALTGEDNGTAPGGGNGNDSWWGMLETNGTPLGAIGVNTGNAPVTVKTPTAINDGEWHYLVMTRNAADDITIYLDGEATPVATGNVGVCGYTFHAIGRGSDAKASHLDAVIDEVAIYDKLLTGTDVEEHYNATLGPSAPTITSAAPEVAFAGAGYRYTIRATGNPAPKITVKGLPAWLKFDGKDTISGTPSKGKVGVTTTSITVTAANRLGAATQRFRVKVRKGGRVVPIVELRFDEARGAATRNTGLSGRMYPAARLTSRAPVWTRNTPPGGGRSALDFGTDTRARHAVDIRGPVEHLKGLRSFTITGWLNCRSRQTGLGGNRVVTWNRPDSDGVDLVFMKNGSLKIAINEWPNKSPAASSAGKITVDAAGGAGNWRFFAVTYDSTLASGHVKYYFGTPTAAATLDVARNCGKGPLGTDIARTLTVGMLAADAPGPNDPNNRMFRGLIDEIRIFGSRRDGSGALSIEQIRAIQGPPAAAAGLPSPPLDAGARDREDG